MPSVSEGDKGSVAIFIYDTLQFETLPRLPLPLMPAFSLPALPRSGRAFERESG
jgi:hypothetical protein